MQKRSAFKMLAGANCLTAAMVIYLICLKDVSTTCTP